MRFVNCARDDKEQNLVAMQFRGEIYYKARVPVEAGSELLVWYPQSCSETMDSSSRKDQTGEFMDKEDAFFYFPSRANYEARCFVLFPKETLVRPYMEILLP